MKYKNAQAVLPDALVKELQSYVQGEYIYVPVEQKRQKRWGEVSGYRKELEKRNWQIKQEYQKGSSMDRLEKNMVCLYLLFEKLYIRSRVRGCRVAASYFLYRFLYRLVRYHTEDRKNASESL